MRLAVLLIAFILAGPARAADGANLATRGYALAERDCGACHATGQRDQSPHRISPPLRELHRRYPIPMLTEALKTGSLAGHDEMPGFDYTFEDARALLTYIDSLSPIGKRYLTAPLKP
ncbi:MAG: hypothetical protein RLZ98_2017 [Pseudomonadota bacterium]